MLWNRIIYGMGVGAVIVSLVSAFTPAWNTAGRAMSPHAVIEASDAIVVLGGGVWSDTTLGDESLRRVVYGIRLHQRGLAPLIVLSGPERVSPPTIPEADVRAKLARDMGIPAGSILLEKTARTTYEESVRIADLLRPHKASRILLVTESLHMRRAKLLFERAGFQVLPAPSDEFPNVLFSPADRLWLMTRLLQETLGLMYYRVWGYL